MTRSLRAVIVASELPFPATTGGRIRTVNLALRLATRHRITIIANHGEESAEASRFLNEHGINTVVVNRDPREIRPSLQRPAGG